MTPAQINMIINGVSIKSIAIKKKGFTEYCVNYEQEVDLAPVGLMPNPQKYQQIDFSVPISMDPCRLVVPYPKEESRLMAPLRPFQPTV